MPRIAVIFAIIIAAVATASRSAAQKPVIDPRGIMNAATLVPESDGPVITPGSGPAEGSIATIFGQNLAPMTVYASQTPLPTSLGGVSVVMTGGPQQPPVALPLFFVSPGQINFQIPNTLTGYFISVHGPNGVSDTISLGGQFSCLGVFTQDASGCGAAWAFNVAEDGSWSLNSPDNSAEPGGLIVILGTGIGTLGFVIDGQPAPLDPPAKWRLANQWRIDVPTAGPVAGEDALYIGRAPGLVGVDQFNFRLPDNTIEGCGVPATIRFTAHTTPLVWDSQPVPINIHRGGGKCPALPPPQGHADLTLLKITTIDKDSTSTTEQLNATVSAAVGKSIPDPVWPDPDAGVLGCGCGFAAPEDWVFGPSCPFPAFLDKPLPVGPVSISGPGLSLQYNPQPTDTAFQVPLPAGSLTPGNFTISARGGAGAGPFSVAVPVMSDISFGDPAPGGVIDSNKTYVFQWSGGQVDEIVRMRLRNKDSWQYCECSARALVEDPTFKFYPGLGSALFHLALTNNGELTISVGASPASVSFTASGLALGGAARWQRVWHYPNIYFTTPLH